MEKSYNIGKPLLSIKGVSKLIGKKLIIRDIGTEEKPFVIHDITRPNMQQGQTVAVVGASGSGKTTLFHLIAGMHSVTTGTIEIPDEHRSGQYKQVIAGDVGFVQQDYPLSRNESVFTMLMDAARKGGVRAVERKEVVLDYLKSWNLVDQRSHEPKQLSGGQRQRVAIIEQLLCSHHLVIFDEPFSGLDVRNIEDVKRSFRSIASSSDINTIVFSTHDIHLAVELSDTVIVMGYEKSGGVIKPGGTILREFDLMASGLAWSETYTDAHREVALEIQNLIKTS